MKRLVLTGALALLGVLAPMSTVAVSSASASASASPSASPVLYHVPIIGKHVLSVLHLGHGRDVRNMTDVQSNNWSGYADINETYQALSGSWVQPAVTCSGSSGLLGLLGLGSRAAYSAFWVGLDGYNSSSVEQTGTDSDCTSSGMPSYYAWYEMYPAGSVQLPTTSYPVKPGDTLIGSVRYDAPGTPSSSYTLTLSDPSEGPSGWTYSTNIAETGLQRSSAEWVAEAPSECYLAILCQQTPLANFGKMAFSNAWAENGTGVQEPISSFTDDDIQMASSAGSPLATPSALTNTKNAKTGDTSSGFGITWQSS